MTICAFGSKKGCSMSVNEYNFYLYGKRSERFYLKGYAVPTICAPLNNYKMEVDLLKEKNKNINWSDYLPSDEIINGNIDILIGADYYWSLITEDVIRLQDNLVLISSKFGYMLSGPMLTSNESESVEATSPNINCCVHVMKVSSSVEDEFSVEGLNPLDDKIERFWNLDSVGILSEEKSVFDNNMDKITFVAHMLLIGVHFVLWEERSVAHMLLSGVHFLLWEERFVAHMLPIGANFLL